MKNNKSAAILVYTLLFVSLLSSCANNGSTASAKPVNTTVPSMATADILPESAPIASPSPSPASPPASPSALTEDKFAFEEMTYKDGGISIKYPRITGMSDYTVQETLNKIISDTALRDVKELISGTEYELTYKVTFNTPAVISIYYDGYAYVPETVHPYQFLRTVTIDIAAQAAVPLAALVNISEDFVGVILNSSFNAMSYDITDEYEAAIHDYLASMGEAFWLDELRNADTVGTATSSFLTEDALVLSVSVPHVMGDHIEIYLPYEALAGYQTDNPIWQEIIK